MTAWGFRPDTLYGGGGLASYATVIDYGGETVRRTTFPPMGSGAFANQHWQHAAYQHTIGYYAPLGAALVNANLTINQEWPSNYTAETILNASWGETLWFGGPGGSL